MFKFVTVYPYVMDALVNNISLMKVYNESDLLYNINDKNVIKRGKTGSRKFDQAINFVIPNMCLKDMEGNFNTSYNILNVKIEVLKLKIKTLKKIKKCIVALRFKF